MDAANTALEQFGRGAVLLTAERHERRQLRSAQAAGGGDSDGGRVGIGGCERRCVLPIGEGGLPVTAPVASEPPLLTTQAGEGEEIVASAGGVDAEMDVL